MRTCTKLEATVAEALAAKTTTMPNKFLSSVCIIWLSIVTLLLGLQAVVAKQKKAFLRIQTNAELRTLLDLQQVFSLSETSWKFIDFWFLMLHWSFLGRLRLSSGGYQRSEEFLKAKKLKYLCLQKGQFDVVELMVNSKFKAFNINLNAQHVNGMTQFYGY